MKRIVFGFLILLCVTSTFAQSGRRQKAETKAAEVAKPISVTTEDGYSDSRPYKPPTLLTANGGSKRDREKPKPVAEPQKSTAQGTGDDEVINIDATLVTIPISIHTRNGLYITDIRPEEVKVFENGVEQEIAYFGVSNKPFTVALLIDTSPSTEFKIEQIRAAAKQFVDQLTPQDKVLVMSFDSSTHLLTEPTNDRNRIYKAIDRASFGGGTALYDAVSETINRQLAKVEGRKAVVMFTDGVDTVSRSRFEYTLRDAEEFDAPFFPVYYNTSPVMQAINGGGINGGILGTGVGSQSGSRPEDYAFGKSYLESLASYTGGKVYEANSTYGGLERAFENIAEELRRQYNLAYYPKEEGQTGERRQIKVRLYRKNLIVRARDSYIVGANQK